MAKVTNTPDTESAPTVRVTYIGKSGIRRLSKGDLQKLGVKNPEADLEWLKGHSKMVPVEVAEALDASRKRVPGFKIEGLNKDADK
jgi:hypothetical protein